MLGAFHLYGEIYYAGTDVLFSACFTFYREKRTLAVLAYCIAGGESLRMELV